MKRLTVKVFVLMALLLAAGLAMAESCSDEFCIDRWTLSGGGAIATESADGQWLLSGTTGQWEATAARQLAGGPWRLTGGFWALNLEELADVLLRDRFEASSNASN